MSEVAAPLPRLGHWRNQPGPSPKLGLSPCTSGRLQSVVIQCMEWSPKPWRQTLPIMDDAVTKKHIVNTNLTECLIIIDHLHSFNYSIE